MYLVTTLCIYLYSISISKCCYSYSSYYSINGCVNVMCDEGYSPRSGYLSQANYFFYELTFPASENPHKCTEMYRLPSG